MSVEDDVLARAQAYADSRGIELAHLVGSFLDLLGRRPADTTVMESRRALTPRAPSPRLVGEPRVGPRPVRRGLRVVPISPPPP